MSAGRKVTVTLTQAEAAVMTRILKHAPSVLAIPFADTNAFVRIREKFDHQLAAVRGKAVTS